MWISKLGTTVLRKIALIDTTLLLDPKNVQNVVACIQSKNTA
jgi:hypothetical protein